MNDPLFLLADEATGNLDSNTELEILDLLDELHREGMTIAMVTHNEDIADRAQRTVWLKDGQVERIDDNRAKPSHLVHHPEDAAAGGNGEGDPC
jgi:putative ABC transport system ATP-binding protein